jgi:hypothetical protein
MTKMLNKERLQEYASKRLCCKILDVRKAHQNNCVPTIEMKGITRCKLTIISESAVCKKFLGQIVSNPASL